MKNLSITLILLSSLMFGTNAYAQSNKRKTTVTTKRTVKNVRPNRKVVKVKTVTFKKKSKKAKRAKKYNKHHKKHYNKHGKLKRSQKVYQNHKWGYRGKHVHYSPRHIVGRRYRTLPRSAVRIVRNGRVEFYAQDAFFRPIYKRGRTLFVVVL